MNIIQIEPDVWPRNSFPPNKWTKRTEKIKYIVMHTTGGTDSRNWLSKWNRINPASDQNNVSIQYLIRRDGATYQIAPDDCRAWHVGVCQMPEGETDGNGLSVGIELEHLNEPDFTEPQLNAAAELVHNLMQHYSIPGKFVVSHASVARPPRRKVDPVHFDWGDFWDRILKLGSKQSTPASNKTSIFPYTGFSPLIATPSVDEQKIVEYIAMHDARPNYTKDDIRLIVNHYIKYGKLSGIDWILALAQSIHETGWFTSWWAARDRRNPAGIGVSGQTSTKKPVDPQNWVFINGIWRRGQSFSSWEIAAQHHIGRLLCYAVKDEEMNTTQLAMSKIIPGRERLAGIRGHASQLIGLNGVWAVPGRTYGQRIAEIGNSIIKIL